MTHRHDGLQSCRRWFGPGVVLQAQHLTRPAAARPDRPASLQPVRSDCTDIPSPPVLKDLLKGEGGAAEWQSRQCLSPAREPAASSSRTRLRLPNPKFGVHKNIRSNMHLKLRLVSNTRTHTCVSLHTRAFLCTHVRVFGCRRLEESRAGLLEKLGVIDGGGEGTAQPLPTPATPHGPFGNTQNGSGCTQSWCQV